MRTTYRCLSLIITLLSAAAYAQPADQSPVATVATPLQMLDLFEFQWVRDPQISPDGKRIAYTRNRFDVMSDETRTSLWMIDSDGNNHQPLTDSDN